MNKIKYEINFVLLVKMFYRFVSVVFVFGWGIERGNLILVDNFKNINVIEKF